MFKVLDYFSHFVLQIHLNLLNLSQTFSFVVTVSMSLGSEYNAFGKVYCSD